MKAKPKANPTKQAILWGRFSSDRQSDGDSRDRQERNNRQFADEHSIHILKEYFDEGVSVKDGPTPLFQQIIASLVAGVGIICEDLDRISRGHPWITKGYIASILQSGHFIITTKDGREYNQDTIEEL